MPYLSSEQPGAHERHLLRKLGNPLFYPTVADDDAVALAQARSADAREHEAFMQRFQGLLQQAVALKPNEESETLLKLKAALDEAYTYCASLGGDLTPLLQGLARLTATVMAAVRRGAEQDPQALMELEQEAAARESHYRLLRFPLVADLMRPDSSITADELVPTLLCAPPDALEAALWLFDDEQLAALCAEGHQLLARYGENDGQLSAARHNLERMEGASRHPLQGTATN